MTAEEYVRLQTAHQLLYMDDLSRRFGIDATLTDIEEHFSSVVPYSTDYKALHLRKGIERVKNLIDSFGKVTLLDAIKEAYYKYCDLQTEKGVKAFLSDVPTLKKTISLFLPRIL